MTKRKILTVVLLSAGCGSNATRSTPTSTSAAPPRAAELPVAQVFGVAHVAEPPPIIAVPASTPPPVEIDEKQPAWRLGLRNTLYQTGGKDLGTQMDRFRALCDADGYPLVGNVASKNMQYGVADYCKDVRSAAKNDV